MLGIESIEISLEFLDLFVAISQCFLLGIYGVLQLLVILLFCFVPLFDIRLQLNNQFFMLFLCLL